MILFLGASLKAQTEKEAIINENGTIALPEDQPVSEMYAFDIASLEFTDLGEAVNYFSDLNSEYFVFRPNIADNKAYLFVQKAKEPDYTAAEWNNHLSEILIFPNQ